MALPLQRSAFQIARNWRIPQTTSEVIFTSKVKSGINSVNIYDRWFRVGHTTCGPSGSEINPDKAQIQLANIIGLAVILVVGLLAGGLVEVVSCTNRI